MKLFELRRIVDATGVSGTGTVAQGVIFDNGKVALTWLTKHTSCAIYDAIADVVAIHGHNGATKVVVVADLDLERIRQKCIVRHLDDCEGVSGSLRAAGINERHVVDEREWFTRLFDTIELTERERERVLSENKIINIIDEKIPKNIINEKKGK